MATSAHFQQSFAKTLQGIGSETTTWKTDLKQLSVETSKMLEAGQRSPDVKTAFLGAIEKLKDKNLNEMKAKQVLLSLYSSLPVEMTGGELQIRQVGQKSFQEITGSLEEKADKVFSTLARKTSPTHSSGKNLEIMQQLAAEKSGDSEVSQRIRKTASVQSPFAAGNVKQLFGEIKFTFSESVHQKAIKNFELLAKEVDKLNQAETAALSYQELQKTLNEARGAMQTAQDIIIDLAKYDDLSSVKLKTRVQDLKGNLEKNVDLLSEQMTVLIGGDKCTAATEVLMQKSQEEQDHFLNIIDLYQKTGETAIALIKVEGDIQQAEQMLEKTVAQEKPDLSDAQVAIASSNKALEQTSKALEAFTEIKAVCPKYTNPLLDRLRNVQKKLTGQTKKVTENPELKKAVEAVNNPEVKKIIETEVKKAEETIIQSQAAVDNLEKPATLEYTEKQKALFAIVNKTIRDESSLENRIKQDISAIAQRAIPLMRITDANLLSKADSFSIAHMMTDYIDLLAYIYEKLEGGGEISKEESFKINTEFLSNGIHDLAGFMSKEYYQDYLKLKPDMQKLIGNELIEKIDGKVGDALKAHQRLTELYNS